MIKLPLKQIEPRKQLNMYLPIELLQRIDTIANFNKATKVDVVIYLLNYAINVLNDVEKDI